MPYRARTRQEQKEAQHRCLRCNGRPSERKLAQLLSNIRPSFSPPRQTRALTAPVQLIPLCAFAPQMCAPSNTGQTALASVPTPPGPEPLPPSPKHPNCSPVGSLLPFVNLGRSPLGSRYHTCWHSPSRRHMQPLGQS